MNFERKVVQELVKDLQSEVNRIHVITGPRQVGKTTAARQVAEKLGWESVFASADGLLPQDATWLAHQWQLALTALKHTPTPVLLILDEIQKVHRWSDQLKYLWDQSTETRLKVMVLGSSALLLQKGLTESLTGRFFLHPMTHWTYSECAEAFGWDLETWLFYGGYPGAVPFLSDPDQWKRYVRDSLIETVISKDILELETIHKPALLRHLFLLATAFPSQILSYNKMLGQLLDAGNTTTLAHYLTLLEKGFLISGLPLFSQGSRVKRGSSPKLILWNNALINAISLQSFESARQDRTWWGRIVENAVGSHLVNHLSRFEWDVTYWRDGKSEVDFVVSRPMKTWAIEVKSGAPKSIAGLAMFQKAYPKAKTLVIGEQGIPLTEFLRHPPERFLI